MANFPGNLTVITKMIGIFGEDMAKGGPDEVAAGVVLDALQVAITVGAVAELAALVKPWLDGKLVTAIHEREVVDMGVLAEVARQGTIQAGDNQGLRDG